MSRMADLLKNAVELNLKYTSTVLHLAKDYLKDASEVVTREPAATPSPSPAPGPAPRAPLLIVGRSGETGNAAFAINNPSEKEINVHLVVQGDLGDDRVKLEPARFALAAGAQVIVRILVPFDDKLPEEQDQVGQVVAPGLSNQTVPFIVRRLASTAVPAAAPADGAAGGEKAAAGQASAAPRAARSRR